MGKAAKGKIPLIFFNLIILIGLSIAYLVFAKNRNQQKTYFDLKTAPEAQTVEELKYLDPAVGAKASLHTDFSVSQTSRWYLDNLTGTGWVLDVPPQNPSDEQVQMIQLAKGVDRLSISLINDGSGGTEVIFEKSGDPNAGSEGEDP